MWFTVLIWLPFALLVAAYLCSWPRRTSWIRVLSFDVPVLLLLLATPAVWLFWPEWFAVSEADMLESRQWLGLLAPLWSTIYAIPIVFVAAVARYFIFRRGTPTA
jgi:hypothetical protein